MRSRIFATAAIGFLLLRVTSAVAQGGYELFQQALLKERVEANLSEAIQIYERIEKDFSSNRPLVARALVQLGLAYEKQRDPKKARAAYDKVMRQFAAEADAVSEARKRLALLDGAPAADGLTQRVAATGDDADPGAHITADGRYLTRPDWESGDLAVRDMILGTTTRMMAKSGTWDSGDEHVDAAMMSPDHKWLAYVWLTAGNDSRYQLRIMPNQAGGKPRLIVDSGEYVYFELAGWSPDGKSILAALSRSDRTTTLAWIDIDGNPKIRPLKFLGWRLTRSRPRLSPDGRYVAFGALAVDPGNQVNYSLNEPQEQHIFVLPTDGTGAETVVVRGPNINESPVWTPDGRRIVFVSNRSGTGFGLWSVGVHDGKAVDSPSQVKAWVSGRILPVAMTNKGAFFFTPSRADAGATDIFLASLHPATGKPAGPLVRLVDNFADRNRTPSWAPDGKRVAFMRQRIGSENVVIDPNALEVVVYEIEGRTEKTFPIRYLDPDAPPIWFQDGKSLLIYQRYDGGNLQRLELETGSSRSIEALTHSRLPEGITNVELSLDDKTIFFTVRTPVTGGGENREIFALDVATGEHKSLWRSDGVLRGVFDFAPSPDGKSLAIALRHTDWTSARLIRVDLNGGDTVQIAQSVKPRTIAWTSRGIYFSSEEDQSKLMFVSPTSNRPEPAGLSGGNQPVSLSPDGLSLVFGQSTREGSQLYVIENLISLWNSAAKN